MRWILLPVLLLSACATKDPLFTCTRDEDQAVFSDMVRKQYEGGSTYLVGYDANGITFEINQFNTGAFTCKEQKQ